jgi:hypothetical protein
MGQVEGGGHGGMMRVPFGALDRHTGSQAGRQGGSALLPSDLENCYELLCFFNRCFRGPQPPLPP